MSTTNLSLYRLCIKSGTFKQQKPTFVIKIGNKYQKRINTYFIPSDKQRYNYDLFLQKSIDADIMFHFQVGQQLLGTAILKVDSRKNQQPNQTLSVMNSKKQKIASIDCSLKKIQKKIKKPPIKIQVIQASFTQQENKQQQESNQDQKVFIVLKYGDANYQTKLVSKTIDNAPIWKQTFQSKQSQAQRIFVENWKEKDNKKIFLGLALIQITKAVGTEKDYQINFDKRKIGNIKIAVYQDKVIKQNQENTKLNDKNLVKQRTIKAHITQTLLKDPSKRGTFIRLASSVTCQKFQTTHSFQSSKQLGFNQSFKMVLNQDQEIVAHLLMNDEMQEQIARTLIKVKQIQNKKYQLKLLDGADKQIGTLYMQFYDQELDIKEEIPNESVTAISKASQQSKVSKISQKTAQRLNQSTEGLKSRYANRQSIHDYMNEVNTVLQQGLLRIAKERPQNPIKQLGLFLINYKNN